MMTSNSREPGSGDLVVVRASELAALRALVNAVSNSSDNAGCSDSFTVIDADALQRLVHAASELKLKPLMDSLRMVHPASERLGSLLVVLPPDRSTEDAQRLVLQCSLRLTAGLGSAQDPDQDAFVSEIQAAGLGVHAGVEDLGVGAWDAPTATLPVAEAAHAACEDKVCVVIQEGGASGELYLHSFDDAAVAEAYRFKARDEGSYRTSPVLTVARRVLTPGFAEAAEEMLRAATLQLSFPAGPAPRGDHEEDDEPEHQQRGERNA